MAFGSMKGKLDEFSSKYNIGQKASSAFQGVKSATVKSGKQVAKVVGGKKSSKDSETAALPDDSMWDYAEQHAANPLNERSNNGAAARAPLKEVRGGAYDSYQGTGSADIWDHAKTNSFKSRDEQKQDEAKAKAAASAKSRGPFDASPEDNYTLQYPEPERYKVFLPGYSNSSGYSNNNGYSNSSGYSNSNGYSNSKTSYERANERASKATLPVRSNSNPFDDPLQ